MVSYTHLTLLRTHTLFINVSYKVHRKTLLVNVGSATALRCVSPPSTVSQRIPGRRGRNQHRAQHTPSIPPTQITQIINRARSSKPSDLKPTQLAIVQSFLTLYPSVTISLLITHIALPHGANCAWRTTILTIPCKNTIWSFENCVFLENINMLVRKFHYWCLPLPYEIILKAQNRRSSFWPHSLWEAVKYYFADWLLESPPLGTIHSDDPRKTLRFWWTESPLKSPQKSARESRPTKKRLLRVSALFWVLKKGLPFFVLLLGGLMNLLKRVKP